MVLQFTRIAVAGAMVAPFGVIASPVAQAQGGATSMRMERHLSDPESYRAHLERQTGVLIGPDGRPQGSGRTGGGKPRLDGSRPTILLTGYWPPSNEGVREFSDDPVQNPNGWIGSDWEGRGYDVYSYFPEFNPRNCRSCGKGSGDLEVDYQDTSDDWWDIVEAIRPIAIITFSRGFDDKSWELEMNQYNRVSWIDDFVSPFQPTPAPPDDGWSDDGLRLSTLPVQEIVDAVDAAGLGLTPYICFSGDGGGYLFEFIAYHGVWYQDLYRSPADPDWCVAGGHIHVGGRISWATAREAVKVSLRELIEWVDQVRDGVTCQLDIGYGGPGVATLTMCGGDLHAGTFADLQLSGAPPLTTAFFLAGVVAAPTPFAGGTLLPMPPLVCTSYAVDDRGRVLLPAIEGGDGPATVFAQFAWLDGLQPFGFGISNALQIELLD